VTGASEANEPQGYRIGAGDRAVDLETRRLAALTAWRDPTTFRVLSDVGLGPGWSCLEVGAGSGTVARWMAERVSPAGSVLSTDIDLRFHCEPTAGMEVREVDVMSGLLPHDAFDVVHARALLMHLPDRAAAVDELVATLRPGGWLVIEDSDWRAFEAQPLPEPLATVADAMNNGLRRRTGWDPNSGGSALRLFAERGLVDLDVSGETMTLHGGTESTDWWTLGIEQAAPRLIEAGAVSQEQLDGALAILRAPDFVMMSQLLLAIRGRRPTSH
jgi:SAM-dependent methyltransferase